MSGRLRVPVVSRLQKVHNTALALTLLQDTMPQEDSPQLQLSQEYPASEIVAGHKETTLGLLWTLIYNIEVRLFASARVAEGSLAAVTSFKISGQSQPHGKQFRLFTSRSLENTVESR